MNPVCSADTQRAPAIVQPSTFMYFGTPAVIRSATNMCFGESWPFCPATNMSLPPTFQSETTLNSPRTLGTSGRSSAASPGVTVSCSLETPFASNSPRTLSTSGRSFAAPPGVLVSCPLLGTSGRSYPLANNNDTTSTTITTTSTTNTTVHFCQLFQDIYF